MEANALKTWGLSYLKKAVFFLSMVFFVAISLEVVAQKDAEGNDTESVEKKRIIQFSGIVLDEDGITPLPGVHIYVPGKYRGTTTDFSGYFTFPLLAGDSLILTSVAHYTRPYKIPVDATEDIKEYFVLVRDTKKLQELTVRPYESEQEFKKAILSMKLPEDRLSRPALSEETMALMSVNAPIDGASAYRQYQDRLFRASGYKYAYQPAALMSLVNPIAWGKFVQDVKRGAFSKRKQRAKERKNRYQSY